MLPTLVVLIITVLSMLLLKMVFNDNIKTGIFISLALILFFSYGHVFDAIEAWQIFKFGRNDIHIHRYLLLSCITIIALSVYLLNNKAGNLHDINNAVNVAAIALFIMPLINISSYEYRNINSTIIKEDRNYTNRIDSLEINLLPDIYYIIPDAHTNSKILSEVFNYDNSAFVNDMIEKGFYVSSDSYSNYAHTQLSLNASLNMEYFENHENYPKRLYLQNNKVLRFVESLGYQTIHLASGYHDTDRNFFADINIRCGYLNEFIMILIPTTMFRIIDERLHFLKLEQRDKVLCSFSKIADINNIKGPKFIFAHIGSPHPPYVFGANGEPVLYEPLTMVAYQPKEGYLNQLIYIENKLTQLVDEIISNSKIQPIIVIQGDHGPATTFANIKAPFETDPTEENLRERMGILNMYYLRNECDDLLYDNISPVNSFRLIFNCYFNANYDMLGDSSYYNQGSESFVNVTEIVSN